MREQFLEYLKNPFAAHLNSVKFSRPVWDVIPPFLWPTLLLVGVRHHPGDGRRRLARDPQRVAAGSRFDKNATNATLVLYSMPEFWFGMILLIIFSSGIGPLPGLFPSGGSHRPDGRCQQPGRDG